LKLEGNCIIETLYLLVYLLNVSGRNQKKYIYKTLRSLKCWKRQHAFVLVRLHLYSPHLRTHWRTHTLYHSLVHYLRATDERKCRFPFHLLCNLLEQGHNSTCGLFWNSEALIQFCDTHSPRDTGKNEHSGWNSSTSRIVSQQGKDQDHESQHKHSKDRTSTNRRQSANII
jgi:hypothetical protein